MIPLEEALTRVRKLETSAYAEVRGAHVTAMAFLIGAYRIAEAIEEASKNIVNEIYDNDPS